MSRSAREYLNHMLDECDFICDSVQSDTTKESFLSNEILKRAVVRSLEIIGEATKKLPSSIKETSPQIPWRNIAGMRDKLIHDYMGVNYGIVWDVVINLIPPLRNQLIIILKELEH
ncbi:MAG: DUF86 domain-containing protein [Lewinellaceae bacterium]|nr:DUF86 domain-containing protein [Lewinellaceae bacterium]